MVRYGTFQQPKTGSTERIDMAMTRSAKQQQEIEALERDLDKAALSPAQRRDGLREQFREANLAAALAAYNDGFPVLALSVAPAWMPQPGDTIRGTVFGIIGREHPEYGHYPIVGVKTPDGALVAIHCLPQTLHDGMRAAKPQVGDEIVAAFVGERISGTRGDGDVEYHLYAVSVPGAELKPYVWEA